ncbi:histidine phosphatase family protein [Actinomyces sp. F1_1611]
MAFTTVHLLRHGEVDNPDGVLYGRLPQFSLTPLGREMASEVAQYLSREERDITRVIASPLLRAQETALPTALAFHLPIEADPRLVEAGSTFQGENVNGNRWALAHPRNWSRYVRPLEPSWGEPYRLIRERMCSAISSAIDEAWGHEALLVSHQLPIVMVQRFIQGKPLAHNPLWRECSLASLTSLLFDDHTLVGWSYTEPAGHLLHEAADVTPGASVARVNEG